MNDSALLADYYELTMAQGYFLSDHNPQVVFDMFFRRLPFGNGYAIFAGLEEFLEHLEELRFSPEELQFLEGTGIFRKEFLDFLGQFQFQGEIFAMGEGSLVFPGEPLVQVRSSLLAAQLIETRLLNTINFQTLIATKASRIYGASREGRILEFGLRRAQGANGGLSASRAAYIGGASATSNTLAGMCFNIPVAGTMAHSWIMAFEDEYQAFKRYAEFYPDNPVFLIDTFDTLGSGIESAIRVGQELKSRGKSIGVRLDSGDLQYLSHKVREKLDQAGLKDASIAVSNDLNEEIIEQLIADETPIDQWGVGTELVTGGRDSSLTGVYKLAASKKGNEWIPAIKISDNIEKVTTPGIKQVYRFRNEDGIPLGDMIALEDEEIRPGEDFICHHPVTEYTRYKMTADRYKTVEPLLHRCFDNGSRIRPPTPLSSMRERSLEAIKNLDPTHKRLINPHIYKVSLSDRLFTMKDSLIKRFLHI